MCEQPTLQVSWRTWRRSRGVFLIVTTVLLAALHPGCVGSSCVNAALAPACRFDIPTTYTAVYTGICLGVGLLGLVCGGRFGKIAAMASTAFIASAWLLPYSCD
jgi:hypothetical protein